MSEHRTGFTDRQLKEIFERFDCGDFKFIDPASFVTGQWVRMKCRFGCPEFGKGLACPPNLPSLDECREFFGDYKRVAIYIDPCNICPACAEQGSECLIPSGARPSGEGLGMDVYATARAAGYTINVVREKTDEMNRYGFLLIE